MIQYLAKVLPHAIRATLGADGRLVSRLERRVRLREIDPNLHMNQAVYAEVFEIGRTDWVLRSRAWWRWREASVHPVVAEQSIVYRRELKPLQRYAIDTRVTAQEGRLLRFEQYLLVDDRVHAKGESKLIFIGEAGVLKPDDLSPHVDGLMTGGLVIEDWKVVG